MKIPTAPKTFILIKELSLKFLLRMDLKPLSSSILSSNYAIRKLYSITEKLAQKAIMIVGEVAV